MEKTLLEYEERVTEVVTGGAKGADSLGERWAKDRNIPCRVFLPDWKVYGRKAGLLRNLDIIKNCDVVVAFWDGKSKGTQHSLKEAGKLGIPTVTVLYAD